MYPVKSMRGGQAQELELTPLGVAADRAWATRDEVRGGIRGAKKLKGLMEFQAEYLDLDARIVRITCPDGTEITTSDADRDTALSRALNHEVTLWPLQPVDDLDHYRRGRPDVEDYEQELRTVFAREDGEPLPDFAGFPAILEHYESPPGTYYDVHPLLLLSTSALRALDDALPTSVISVERFRPSIVVDTGEMDGHPEFDWVGRGIEIGDAVLRVEGPCPRCVMVTHAVSSDIPQDRRILRHVVRDLDQNVGVYATVSKPGRITVGDELTLRP